MTHKKVILAGDPKLKTKNLPVLSIKSSKTQKLIKDLVLSMKKTDLVGIAANQIGENYQIFVTFPRSTKARSIGKKDKVRIYINPKFTYKSKQQTVIYEGCGSVGDIFGPVSRPKEVEIEAMDENGNKFRLKTDGLLARIIQHEMDHLGGIEFLEKVDDLSKVIVKEHYKNQIKNSKKQIANSLITKLEYALIN
jgi:peptide deformylase